MDHTVPKVNPLKVQEIKARNLVKQEAKKPIKYSELVDKDLENKLQVLDFITSWTTVEHVHRVNQTTLACVVDSKNFFHYLYNTLCEN